MFHFLFLYVYVFYLYVKCNRKPRPPGLRRGNVFFGIWILGVPGRGLAALGTGHGPLATGIGGGEGPREREKEALESFSELF